MLHGAHLMCLILPIALFQLARGHVRCTSGATVAHVAADVDAIVETVT